MDKSPEAFRTISEVAESLETPAHVLRFWESRFPQIKPVKRAGGRRYYRPADVALLGGIRHLLHDEGMTIRGVQKILREQGVRHVAAMAAGSEGIEFDSDLLEDEDFAPTEEAEPETAQIFALDPVSRPASPPPAMPAEVVRLRAVPEPASPVVPEEVPEAGHVWVEDEPEMELAPPAPLFATRPPEFALGPDVRTVEPGQDLSEGFVVRGALRPALPMGDMPVGTVPADSVDDAGREALQLSGIAARLRALAQPISPEAAFAMLELHSRLGLLHAQMAEAQRLRR